MCPYLNISKDHIHCCQLGIKRVEPTCQLACCVQVKAVLTFVKSHEVFLDSMQLFLLPLINRSV